MPSGFLLLIKFRGKTSFPTRALREMQPRLLCLIAKSIVFFEPPVNTDAIEKMTLPSESRTFHSVRRG